MLGLLATALITTAVATELPIDERTGLVIDDDWVLVNGHCGACHSHKLVTAQRGDAEFWLSTIRWMQRTQKLWPLPPDQEQKIVAYLARNYNESDWGRRPALRASLLPPAADETPDESTGR